MDRLTPLELQILSPFKALFFTLAYRDSPTWAVLAHERMLRKGWRPFPQA